MTFVFDASPLIYLGKIKLLEKVTDLEGQKIVPKSVYNEVVLNGLERREPEAGYINGLILQKKLIVANPFGKMKQEVPLSKADTDVIMLAKEKNAIAIIDEIYARTIAQSLGVKKHGTIYLILLLLERKKITKKEAKHYIDEIIKHGFYLSIEMYAATLQKIEGMK